MGAAWLTVSGNHPKNRFTLGRKRKRDENGHLK